MYSMVLWLILFLNFIYLFWLWCVWGILVHQPGIELRLPALKHGVLTTGLTGKSLPSFTIMNSASILVITISFWPSEEHLLGHF